MFDLSHAAANAVFGWSNAFLILGAAFVLFSTIGIFWSGGIRENYNDERISKNEADTAMANADAAKANAKAAEANAEAAEAKLALAKYREPWKLNEEKYQRLVEQLSISPKGKVVVKPNLGDMQATTMAKGITRAFIEAGFSGVGDAPLEIISAASTGLVFAVKDAKNPPKHAPSVFTALKATQLPVEYVFANWVPDLDTVVILVCIRP